jgi:glycosyltransferase involved in cell wall biosynthesis
VSADPEGELPRVKVVHIINALPSIGGAERLILDLAMLAAEPPVPVITWWGTDNSLLRQDHAGVLDLIPLRPFSLTNLGRARRALREAHAIHLHLFPTQYLVHLLRKPTLFTEHNTTNRRRGQKIWWPLERHCYRRFSKVVAISAAVGDALSEWLAEAPPRLQVIENGVALSRFSHRLRTCPTGEVKIGMAARICEQKDHATLIRALALLPARYRLLLAGDGELRGVMEKLACDLGVGERVDFLGIVADMRSYYESLDLYVQSTNSDGFSLVVVEAMASGLPALTSDVPGIRDVVANPLALYPLGDARQLAARISAITGDPQTYGQMSAFALAQADKYDIGRTYTQYQRAYAEVAGLTRFRTDSNAVVAARKNQKKGSQNSVTNN